MKKIINASILNADFANLQDQLDQATQGGIDWLHLDIMDGHFVPNISMGPSMARICRNISDLPMDAHLMISNPNDFIPAFADAGVDLISVHVEGDAHIHRTLQNIKKNDCKTGIVLNPGTPASAVSEVMDMVDLILVMSVNPGFGGQKFIPSTLTKIAQLKKMISDQKRDIYLQVDGGVNAATLPAVLKAGANSFVIGSAIFRNEKSITDSVKELKTIIGD